MSLALLFSAYESDGEKSEEENDTKESKNDKIDNKIEKIVKNMTTRVKKAKALVRTKMTLRRKNFKEKDKPLVGSSGQGAITIRKSDRIFKRKNKLQPSNAVPAKQDKKKKEMLDKKSDQMKKIDKSKKKIIDKENEKPSPAAGKTDEEVPNENEGLFRCPFCPRRYHLSKELINHFSEHQLNFGSKPETKSSPSDTISDSVDRKVLKKKTVICPKCNKGFPDSRDLRLHLLVHDESRPFKCSQCNFFYNTIRSKRIHETLVHNKKPICKNIRDGNSYKCLLCNLRSRHRVTMMWHLKSVHGEVPAKSFKVIKNADSNSIKKPRNCSKTYARGLTLKKEGKKFKCPKCPYYSNEKLVNLINRHLKKVHDESRPIKCSKCNYYYESDGQLRIHENKFHRRPVGETRKPCQVCGKAFRLRYLDKHIKTHQGKN